MPGTSPSTVNPRRSKVEWMVIVGIIVLAAAAPFAMIYALERNARTLRPQGTLGEFLAKRHDILHITRMNPAGTPYIIVQTEQGDMTWLTLRSGNPTYAFAEDGTLVEWNIDPGDLRWSHRELQGVGNPMRGDVIPEDVARATWEKK